MEAILLGVNWVFVWLIFFKFEWLPWNTTSCSASIQRPTSSTSTRCTRNWPPPRAQQREIEESAASGNANRIHT